MAGVPAETAKATVETKKMDAKHVWTRVSAMPAIAAVICTPDAWNFRTSSQSGSTTKSRRIVITVWQSSTSRRLLADNPALVPAPCAAHAAPVLLDARVDVGRPAHVDASLLERQDVHAMPHIRGDLR